ncbi:MAG: alpha-galactosidase [Acidimicrobiaceae bacterium]|jgi:alpha-galactosidase
MQMFCHGYQSWSESEWRTIGVDHDPSSNPDAIPLVIDMHSGDPTPAAPGELRSELVTALRASRDEPPSVVGGPGTLRFVDGELQGGTRDFESFEQWADTIGREHHARVSAPFQVGWCSWYHYFDSVTEDDIRANLTRADGWPFDVFQIDDGFQSELGDWLVTNDKFPSTLDQLAESIAAEGRRPGLWIAPFLAAPSADVARQHPDWFAMHASGRRLVGAVGDHWGGAVHVLDTTNPEVLAHLERVARELVEAGFTYLKLDFTYAPGLAGTYADAAVPPGQRVRAGFDAIRNGAGDEAFLLGCGAPLGAAIGVVDGMRIGPDVAPWWDLPADRPFPPGYKATQPSTASALRATEARQFMHRRLWLNDPDCVMLRTTDTHLTQDEVRRWALAVGDSGGMVLVSDDLSLLDANGRSLLDEVIARGREVDRQAIGSTSARTNVW